MESYRKVDAAVYVARRRFDIVTAAASRDHSTTVAQVARQHHCSRAQVYVLTRRVLDALAPGPRHHAALTVPSCSPAAAADLIPAPDPRVLVCQLTARHVSVDGIHEILTSLGLPGRDREALCEMIGRLGRAARRLMARACEQLRSRLQCLAGDDIFFHRVAVKVLMEPVSGAVLDVLRWPWRKAEDWELWIAQWPALRLFVSDMGKDLVGATGALRLPHQADKFHERQWWNRKVFARLSRREKALAQRVFEALERATRPGPVRGERPTAEQIDAIERERLAVEAEFYAAVAAEMHVLPLFDPLGPRGRPWDEADCDGALTAAIEHLVKLPHAMGLRVAEHLYRYQKLWIAQRALWDAIDVTLRPGSRWSGEEVVNAVLDLRTCRRDLREATDWATVKSARAREGDLVGALAAACSNVAAVEREVASLLSCPRRSSSLVESFNAVLRVAQQAHRHVSDDLLAILALRWNLSPRTSGARRGPSPYARLGVDFANEPRPWYEILLEELDRA